MGSGVRGSWVHGAVGRGVAVVGWWRVQPERRSQHTEPVLMAVAEELGLGGQVVDAVEDERWRVAEEPGGGRRVEE